MSTICSPFSSQLITSNFSSILTVFQWFFIGTELGDVGWRFLLMLVRKADAVDEETKWAMSLYHQHNQPIHMSNGVTVMPLTASLLRTISAAKECLCQIMLYRKLSRKFKKWCKVSSRINVKLCEKKSHKTRPACNDKCTSSYEDFWEFYDQ